MMTATESTDLDHVILVDKDDNEMGVAEKLLAHQNNLLHRAFSIFIFRLVETKERKILELLIQQRALHKYHTGGLWTNTCCSHPRPDESIVPAANRRLQEELGIIAPLTSVGYFYYNAYFINGLYEHEIDHVLVGMIKPDQAIVPNPGEVNAYRFLEIDKLNKELQTKSHLFTPWFEKAWIMAKNSYLDYAVADRLMNVPYTGNC
jgi:isopentenyl-diphosphate delta-isomerase type 1